MNIALLIPDGVGVRNFVLGPFLLDKTRQPEWKESAEWQREFQLD